MWNSAEWRTCFSVSNKMSELRFGPGFQVCTFEFQMGRTLKELLETVLPDKTQAIQLNLIFNKQKIMSHAIFGTYTTNYLLLMWNLNLTEYPGFLFAKSANPCGSVEEYYLILLCHERNQRKGWQHYITYLIWFESHICFWLFFSCCI